MIYLKVIDDKLIASFKTNYGDSEAWNNHIRAMKSTGFKYNPSEKYWYTPIALFQNKDIDLLKLFVKDIFFSDYDKDLLKNYYNNMKSELDRYPEINNIDYSEFSDYKPIVGKSPFESFQDEDIRKALSFNRFLFNWDMGCGKSFATSIIYSFLAKNRNCGKMFLFTSKIGTANLKSELIKFCKYLTDDDIFVFSSSTTFNKLKKIIDNKNIQSIRRIFDIDYINNKKVLVFNYDTWKLVADAYSDKPNNKDMKIPLKNFFQNYEPLLCLDECHKLANPSSDRSKAIMKYWPCFKYRYAFSATPADKPEKLYSIAKFLDPYLVEWLNYNTWVSKYNELGTYFSKYAINKNKWDLEALDKLNNRMSRLSSKRMAVDVLDLPELKLVKPFIIEMDPQQLKLYKYIINRLINDAVLTGNDEYGLADIIRDSFLVVQNFLENPNVCGLDSTNTVFSDDIKKMCEDYNYSKNFAKLSLVDDIVDDEMENGNRGIIWYTHPKTLEELKIRYKKYNPISISSNLNDIERSELIDKFKKDDSHKICIASINIMNTSITLTEASYAVYLENTYSYENYYQSTGRIYRYGQSKPVRIYHMFYKDTVNMQALRALNSKKDLVDSLFSSNKCKMSLTEIKDLFTGN